MAPQQYRGQHGDGRTHVYYHDHSTRAAHVRNMTGKTHSSDTIIEILNGSRAARESPNHDHFDIIVNDGRFKIVHSRRQGGGGGGGNRSGGNSGGGGGNRSRGNSGGGGGNRSGGNSGGGGGNRSGGNSGRGGGNRSGGNSGRGGRSGGRRPSPRRWSDDDDDDVYNRFGVGPNSARATESCCVVM